MIFLYQPQPSVDHPQSHKLGRCGHSACGCATVNKCCTACPLPVCLEETANPRAGMSVYLKQREYLAKRKERGWTIGR